MRVFGKAVLFASLFFCMAALSGCGRRAGLDTPVSYEQALPGTPEAEAAANPPLGPNGKPEKVPTRRQPEPAMRSFPLDPLLN
ncbi:MAG: hypothetical protein V4691_03445 [Pseudomonadota bacterium]